MKRLNVVCLLSFLMIGTLAGQDCLIETILTEPSECENGQFFIEFDFTYQNTSDSFTVQGNGQHYGSFAYTGLPFALGPFDGDGQSNYEFLICDREQPDCCEAITLESVDCDTSDCSIRDLIAEPLPCVNDSFDIVLDFIHENTSDSFSVVGNGTHYGAFAYENLPIQLGPFNGNGETVYEFLVCDRVQQDCCEAITIETVDCDTSDCSIRDLIAEPLPCIGDSFDIVLDFIHENTSDSFSVVGNGTHYGAFAYEDLPIQLGPFYGNGETVYEFLVCDRVQQDCCEAITIESVNCDSSSCSIQEVIAETHPCENGQFFVDISFDSHGTSDSFSVQGNGTHYGTFPYTELHLTLGPFDGHGPQELEFIICDQELEDCCAEVVISAPDCSGEECELSDLCIKSYGCDGAFYYMEIDFDYQGVSGVGFDVFIDDEFYGFYSYEELPISLESPTIADGQSHHIRLCENDHSDCCVGGIFIAPLCTDCVFDEFEYDIVQCEEGQFYLSFDFSPHHLPGDQYIITANDELIGLYEYADLPQLIGPFTADGHTAHQFMLYDVLEPSCSRHFTLEAVECDMVSTQNPNTERSQQIAWNYSDFILEFIPTFDLRNAYLFIYSSEGKSVYKRKVNGGLNNPMIFKLNKLSSGYYVASLQTMDGIFNYKFIITE